MVLDSVLRPNHVSLELGTQLELIGRHSHIYYFQGQSILIYSVILLRPNERIIEISVQSRSLVHTSRVLLKKLPLSSISRR